MAQYYIPVGEVVKLDPKSEGIDAPRKKRPKEIAVITECCTGCAGSPACVPYCPVLDCMYWVVDEENLPSVASRLILNSVSAAKSARAKAPTGVFWMAVRETPSKWCSRKKWKPGWGRSSRFSTVLRKPLR